MKKPKVKLMGAPVTEGQRNQRSWQNNKPLKLATKRCVSLERNVK